MNYTLITLITKILQWICCLTMYFKPDGRRKINLAVSWSLRRMWGTRVKAPLILKLDTRWWLASSEAKERRWAPNRTLGSSTAYGQFSQKGNVYCNIGWHRSTVLVFRSKDPQPCGPVKQTYRKGLFDRTNPDRAFSNFFLTKQQINMSKAVLICYVSKVWEGWGCQSKWKPLYWNIKMFHFNNVIISEGHPVGAVTYNAALRCRSDRSTASQCL